MPVELKRFQVELYNSQEDIDIWFQRQINSFEVYQQRERRIVLFVNAPRNPEEGDVVRADGVGWDPGSGRGYYGRDDGDWVFLG